MAYDSTPNPLRLTSPRDGLEGKKIIQAYAEQCVTYNAYRQPEDTVFVALDQVDGHVRFKARKPIGWFNGTAKTGDVWVCGDVAYLLTMVGSAAQREAA